MARLTSASPLSLPNVEAAQHYLVSAGFSVQARPAQRPTAHRITFRSGTPFDAVMRVIDRHIASGVLKRVRGKLARGTDEYSRQEFAVKVGTRFSPTKRLVVSYRGYGGNVTWLCLANGVSPR